MIKIAELTDLPEILECLKELSDTEYVDYRDIQDAFRAREECGNIVTFVYKEKCPNRIGHKVVGTATAIVMYKLSHGGNPVLYIDDVAVLKEKQGCGIGEQLIQCCIDYAKSVYAYKVILTCKPNLVPYYKKFGFKQAGMEMRLNVEGK